MNKNFYGWYVVFINAFIGCVLSAALPQASMTAANLAEIMKVTQEAVMVGETVKTIGIIVGMMSAGFVYKKLGAKKTFTFVMLVLVPSMVFLPYITSLPVYYVVKLFQGAAAVIFPIFLIIIMGWIDEKNRGLSTALFNGIFYGGAGIGGTFSGFIISKFGWIESYWALAIVQLIAAVVWIVTVKENPKAIPQEEEKGKMKFTDMIKMPIVWFLVVGFVSTTWCVQAISVDMPLFGTYLGYGELETGKVMSAITIGIIAACIVSGKASDFFAAKSENKAIARVCVLMVGCATIIVSVAMLIIADLSTFSAFYIAVLVFSFGSAWGLGAFYSILPEIFSGDTLPVATGFIGGFGDAGMTVAPVVVGIMFGVKGYWKIGWGMCAVVAALSIVACILIINSIKKTKKNSLKDKITV